MNDQKLGTLYIKWKSAVAKSRRILNLLIFLILVFFVGLCILLRIHASQIYDLQRRIAVIEQAHK